MKTARTPVETDALFGEFANAQDLDAMMTLYEPAATFVVADGALRVGGKAIRAELAGMMVPGMKVDIGEIRVVPLSDDLAVTHHDWIVTVAADEGPTTVLSGRATEVVRRQADGRWLFLLDEPNMRG